MRTDVHSEPSPIEAIRLVLQAKLDSAKTSAERNQMGQFATPTILAKDILLYGLRLLGRDTPIRFLDPAIGTGSFYSALIQAAGKRKISAALGIEIDLHYGQEAKELWSRTKLDYRFGDFTAIKAPEEDAQKATLLICNPPYVRHHHLSGEQKKRLQALSLGTAGVELSGLAGLYCHFMALAHDWMADDGVAGWLIPSEFMEVNYGRELKRYLLTKVTLLHIHRFDPNDVQFDDALVSSAVVWFRKSTPPKDHTVKFTFGGSLNEPTISKTINISDLGPSVKWTRFPRENPSSDYHGLRLGDLFSIKRGLATGDNAFFILDEQKAKELDLPPQFLRPILPSTRHVPANEINADSYGLPKLEKRLLLIDCDLPEEEIQRDFPALWAYLRTGIEEVSTGYLCRTRRRWYAQENRQAAPIVCTYIGRSDHEGRPFRFILNHSRATATNVFLMLYPKPLLQSHIERDSTLLRQIWQSLNEIDAAVLLGNGRVYGGGMHKLEPKELANVPVSHLAEQFGLGATNPEHIKPAQQELGLV